MEIFAIIFVISITVGLGVLIWWWILERHHGMRCINPLGHRFVTNRKTRVCKACGLIQKVSGFPFDLWDNHRWDNHGYSEDKDLLIHRWKVERKESKERSRQNKIAREIRIKNTVIKIDPSCEKNRKADKIKEGPK